MSIEFFEIPQNISYQNLVFTNILRENKLLLYKYIILLSINLINGLESLII